MKEDVRILLEKKWGKIENDSDFYYRLTSCKSVWQGDHDEHRWWIEFTEVVELEGRYFGFANASTTGDMGLFDVGWEFDPDTIGEYAPESVETIIYKPIKIISETP